MIEIAYAIVRSFSATPAPDPVLFINGGPGGATYPMISTIVDDFAPILATRDVIFYDARGVGFSTPSLDCTREAFVQYPRIIDLMAATSLVDVAQGCRARLEAQGVDLSMYTTQTQAADAAALPAALGYSAWNLYGISYGTRVALTVLRDYSQGVRSVVLDSALPADMIDNTPHLEHVFDLCAADGVCNAVYPNLETRYTELIARLNETPLDVAGRTINGVQLHGLLNDVFAGGVVMMPSVISDIADGDTTFLREAFEEFDTPLPPGSNLLSGTSISTMCHEVVPFVENNGIVNAEVCAAWGVAPISAQQATISDVPTLVLAGTFDVYTPLASAYHVAETLSQSRVVEFPIGHAMGTTGMSCPMEAASSFFDAPTAPKTDCASKMRAPWFVIRARTATPFVFGGVALMGAGIAAFGMRTFAPTMRQRWGMSWRSAWRSVGLVQAVGAILLIGALEGIPRHIRGNRVQPWLEWARILILLDRMDHTQKCFLYEVFCQRAITPCHAVQKTDQRIMMAFHQRA
jgi:pimeloyl-ACP methyl ester carboxylesterase